MNAGLVKRNRTGAAKRKDRKEKDKAVKRVSGANPSGPLATPGGSQRR